MSKPTTDTSADQEITAYLRQHHTLTPAHARLAVTFLRTASVPAAADSLGIAHTTARQYMKAIYARTGTGNQAAQMKLLMSLRQRRCGPE